MSTTPGPRRLLPSPRQLVLLVVGCVVLGVGVGLLLAADLGSDGYSTLVYGTSLALGVPFAVANLGIGVLFVGLAALRRVVPGLGTVVQVVLVGLVVSWALELLAVPDAWWQQGLLLAAAFPVLALGIAAYLGSQTGAGPTEAMALAWDPPVPFRWSYSLVQGGGALVGWLCGATVGLGTLAVIALLGPGVDLAARVLRVDVHQPAPGEPAGGARGDS
ncbi:hypothetical protein [Nocardioides nanhaiensis]|uniref:hypothetical protein n=1 Tax=Nocardioides nanhaiensis TaxID=1476871 RepID=UPI0031E653DC